MNNPALVDVVRRMRAEGASPKEIARSLGVQPAVITPLVRQVAGERAVPPVDEAEVVGCWVSPGWSSELQVVRREGWEDVDLGPDGPKGIALALVARATAHDQISVCGYLVDTFCLGVKDVIGPQRMRRRDLPGFVRTYFMAFPAPAVPAPVELAGHLVLGAVAYAASLGFSPHPDFERSRSHLGHLDEPSAITFGRDGTPLYIAGPHDDPLAILETLEAGAEEFASRPVLATAGRVWPSEAITTGEGRRQMTAYVTTSADDGLSASQSSARSRYLMT